MPLGEFLDALAAEGAVPAGGAAAGLTAALAAGLLEMAAGGSPDWDGARGATAQAHALRARAMPLAQADAEAYAHVLPLLAPAAEPSDPKRDFALRQALERAAQLPLEIAETAADAAELAAHLVDHCASTVRGEVLTAAALAESAARAGLGLVSLNLATTPDDGRVERARGAATAAAAARRRVESAL